MSQLSGFDSVQQYPIGHANHLTADQTKALDEFKTICRDAGYYSPASDENANASHDDETLLRFLRARKFVPKDAFRQFQSTEDWRKEQDIAGVYASIDIDEYEQTRGVYTQWTGRRDKQGIPLYVLQVAGLDSKRMAAYEASTGKAQQPGELPSRLRRLFAGFEHLGEFVMPLCSSIPSRPFPETPVAQTNNIVDLSGVGIRQFWTLRQHLQDASTIATAHYPEMLGRIFIIGAPSFFPTIWGWIKGWLDPGTVAKIFILSQAEVKPTLERFVETCDIPKRYGGTLDWDFGQLPVLDPEILKFMTLEDAATTIPIGPIRWKQGKDEACAHALGSVLGAQRDVVVARMSSGIFLKNPSKVTV